MFLCVIFFLSLIGHTVASGSSSKPRVTREAPYPAPVPEDFEPNWYKVWSPTWNQRIDDHNYGVLTDRLHPLFCFPAAFNKNMRTYTKNYRDGRIDPQDYQNYLESDRVELDAMKFISSYDGPHDPRGAIKVMYDGGKIYYNSKMSEDEVRRRVASGSLPCIGRDPSNGVLWFQH